MKRSKKLWVLLGVLALCCIAAFAVTKMEEKKEAIRNAEEVILALTSADVQSVSWETAETSLAFHRDDSDVWKWDEDDAFPVSDEVMTDMLSVFQSFTTTFAIDEVDDYSQYGLDTPEGTITLTAGDTTYTVKLGAVSKMDSQRYVDIGDGSVYLVSTDPMEVYDAVISDMIDHDELPTFATVDSITFTDSASYTLSYKEDTAASYCAEDVYFWEDQPLDTESVETYLTALSGMSLTDYVSYNATAEELEAYGLAEPTLTATVNYTVVSEEDTETANTFTILVGVITEEAESDEEEPATTAYARVGDSQIIYKLAKDDENSILAYTYNDLRHQDMFTADFETVTAMDITLEGISYHLETAQSTAEDAEEGDMVWKYGQEEIDASGIRSKLSSLAADSFTDAMAEGKEELRIVLHLNNDHANTLQIVLYRQDGEFCLCEINGVSTALVPRTNAVELIEAVNHIVLN